MKIWLTVSLLAAFFLGWAYVHTDEITVILAFLLAIGFALGFAFPRYWPATWLVLGSAAPIDEVLIDTFHLRAPFEGGHPLTACVAFVPAIVGVAIGRFSRGRAANAGASNTEPMGSRTVRK